MRRVMVMEFKKFKDESNLTSYVTYITTKVDVREALFHEFGSDIEEFDNGVGTFSTAIVEYEDGTIDNITVELIRFLDPIGV